MNRSRPDGLSRVCKECQKRYLKGHYDANKSYYAKKARAAEAETRAFIAEAKNKPCADCKERYPPWVMDFDHRAGAEKEFNLSGSDWRSRKKIAAEIAKCDVVCANCHRQRTHERLMKK
jgi:hypothetical protein